MSEHRRDPLRTKTGRPLLLAWAMLPSLAACLLAASPSPAAAESLPSERALLGLALAVSLSHAGSQNQANSMPGATQTEAGPQTEPSVDVSQSGAPVPGTGDSGAGSRAPTAQGGPNGPDDRNAGSGGPVGGTTPAPSGAGQGSGDRTSPGSTSTLGTAPAGSIPPKSSGDDSGSGSESNGSNQRSPSPQQ